MKITIAKSSGFCFGVRLAIEKAKMLTQSGRTVHILGDIVHNNFVVQDLKNRGIKKIFDIKPVKNSTLIIRAHGAPKKTFEKARKCGYKITDATCPKVKDIYKIAKRLEKNNKILIIGDKDHDEVKGIIGQLKKRPIVIENAHDINSERFKKIKKAAVITQSTQTIDNIQSIMTRLSEIISTVKLYDTTCWTTSVKQKEITLLPKKNDLILIIGSKTSANTKHLYEMSKKINKKTYWIDSAKDLNPKWFKNIKKTGIMAGASTPDNITEETVKILKKMK
ncbi:MAG: 4-hydroxy-3-methylbut-2-enyl diphosphate reductase [Candidatus Omnitrophica bacterium]|nr:4-hydroxy-3-methylbut-2-enyl diphosphate reductase [Candidatus Omnitrophota bacterium]